jgi:DNA anti-recombination protein RmuC
MIIWSARPASGPKAPLGAYQVRITAGDFQDTQSFEILIDPNLKGITAKDLQEQFELAMQIRDKTTVANEAVIKIREMRKQLSSRLQKAADETLESTAQPFLEKIAEIEQELYQVKNQSNQDPLNFPIKLNNRLASLRRSMENGDARPTDAAYQVFKELSQELERHLKDLDHVMSAEVPKINAALKTKGLKEMD